MVESRVKVFTDFIDFDPSDDDVDPTPVTVSEAAAFDLSKNFSGCRRCNTLRVYIKRT